MIYIDAGTTYSKVISSENLFDNNFFVKKEGENNYYILPSSMIKEMKLNFNGACGHMAKASTNEIIALANGSKKKIDDKNALIMDLGSRDVKWISFKDNKFHDMDWNTACASSTGATIEMILKFYNLKVNDLSFEQEKYNVTCGIFGIEKIMDEVSNGITPKVAISKFVHGIAFNSWNFAKRPNKIYLSGGFCENKCFMDSLANYCEIIPLGRFTLCEGLF